MQHLLGLLLVIKLQLLLESLSFHRIAPSVDRFPENSQLHRDHPVFVMIDDIRLINSTIQRTPFVTRKTKLNALLSLDRRPPTWQKASTMPPDTLKEVAEARFPTIISLTVETVFVDLQFVKQVVIDSQAVCVDQQSVDVYLWSTMKPLVQREPLERVVDSGCQGGSGRWRGCLCRCTGLNLGCWVRVSRGAWLGSVETDVPVIYPVGCLTEARAVEYVVATAAWIQWLTGGGGLFAGLAFVDWRGGIVCHVMRTAVFDIDISGLVLLLLGE